MSLTWGQVFEEQFRDLLVRAIEERKEDLSRALMGSNFERMVGQIAGLREALELCDIVRFDINKPLRG